MNSDNIVQQKVLYFHPLQSYAHFCTLQKSFLRKLTEIIFRNPNFKLFNEFQRLHNLLNMYELFTTQSRLLTTPTEKPFENIVGKGENAGYHHFLFISQCFYPSQNKFQIFSAVYFVICTCFQLGPVKNFVTS